MSQVRGRPAKSRAGTVTPNFFNPILDRLYCITAHRQRSLGGIETGVVPHMVTTSPQPTLLATSNDLVLSTLQATDPRLNGAGQNRHGAPGGLDLPGRAI